MKKLILMAALVMGFSAKAQDYYQGVGIGWNIGLYHLSYQSPGENYSGTSTLGVPLAFYKATLGFEISRKSNFGISAYPGIGGFISTQYGSQVAVQLPILAEMYFGDIDDRNFNVGAGFAYSGIFVDGDGGSVLGPQLSVGGQFEFRDQLIGLRGYYTLGINKSKFIPDNATDVTDRKSMFGVAIHYVLGQ